MLFHKKATGCLYIISFAAVLLIVLAACKKSMDRGQTFVTPVVHDTVTTPPSANKSYLALGDSYTIGQSVATEERFPNQARALLFAGGTNIGQLDIVATTGWTTGNLLAALAANPPLNKYDVVTLLIGVNNQYQGRTLSEYRQEFASLLSKSIGYARNMPTHVIVLSIPDYSVTPYANGMDSVRIAMEIDQFNAANKDISFSMGVQYLDITPVSREGATDATLQAPDGLHPSGKQYGRWAALLAPMIKAVL